MHKFVWKNEQGDYRGPKPKREWVAEWVSKNDDFVRSLPIYVGGISLLAVLFNRTVSGIAPVADASRSVLALQFISPFVFLSFDWTVEKGKDEFNCP